jgi:hypothetical protein
VLLRFDKSGELINTYAVHFWNQLMHRTLEAVRKAANSGAPLHQTWLNISFTEADECNSLIVWMLKCISAAGDEYEARKKSYYQSLGYEEGYGGGQLTVQAESTEEIVDGFLGLGDGLKITQFVFTPARFGIPDLAPQADLTEGRIVVSPEPVGTCEIRIRGGGINLLLPGKIFSFSTADMSDAQKSLRFSTSFLHLISSKNSSKLRFRLELNYKTKADLLTLWQFATVRSLFAGEHVDVQVWVNGKRALAGDLNANLGDAGGGWFKLSSFIELLKNVAGTQDVQVSIVDLAKASREETLFSSINSASTIQLEFIPLLGAPTRISSVIFYSRARVADHNFYILSTRAAEDVFVEGRRQITCSSPAFIESYFIQGDHDAGLEQIEADYKRYLNHQELVETPMGLGNIHEFLKSLSAPQE